MPRTIKDADAAEYFGYVVMDNDSDRFEARARREAAKRRDKSVGIEDPFKRCTCNIRVAGDTISVEDCARHGVKEFKKSEIQFEGLAAALSDHLGVAQLG